MNITQKPGNKKIIFKKYIPKNIYQYNRINCKENADLNNYNNFQNNPENQEEEEQIDYNNEQNEEEEEYYEGEENIEEEDENENNYYSNYNKEKQFSKYNNVELENNKNISFNNTKNTNSEIIIPKYYRNNPLIYKGNLPKRKIHRNLREENPLKSVAQKICNIVIKGDESKGQKNKIKENSQKNFDMKESEDNDEYLRIMMNIMKMKKNNHRMKKNIMRNMKKMKKMNKELKIYKI